jgi:transposase
MAKYIMVGCDLHDKNMLLKIAEGRGKARKRSYENNPSGRKAMIAALKKRASDAGGAKVFFAYEASCQGFGLYDELTDAGIKCYVLAPTKIARSLKQRRDKTDEKDAHRILELLRAHVLAGNELPTVWVPDPQTRDDREVVRARLDATEKLTCLKAQVKSLLKRNGLKKPSGLGKGWTGKYRAWLRELLGGDRALSSGGRVGLGTLLRQMEAVEQEIRVLDKEVESLSNTERYARLAAAMTQEKGVGILTAMVFLTEMGDLSRFSNRRQVGAYLGLAPSSGESGENDDRKGHITHHGNARVRKALCQATWSRVRSNGAEREVYDRIVKKNPKHKKIAVVAVMRRLAVRLWHTGCRAQMQEGRVFLEKERAAVV